MPILVHVVIDVLVVMLFVFVWFHDHVQSSSPLRRRIDGYGRPLLRFLGLEMSWRMFAHVDVIRCTRRVEVWATLQDGTRERVRVPPVFELNHILAKVDPELVRQHGIHLLDRLAIRYAREFAAVRRIEIVGFLEPLRTPSGGLRGRFSVGRREKKEILCAANIDHGG